MNVRISWNRTRGIALALAGSIVALHAAASAAAAQEPIGAIEDLQWLDGSWSVTNGDQVIEEHWTVASNALLGMGRTLSGGRMVAFEYLRVETRPDGIFYVAQPGGRPPTAFRLTAWDGQMAVFENPDHDFPKRVMYTRTGDDAITARVDGGEGTNALTFTYTRMR